MECSDIIFGCADVAQTVEQLIRNEKVEGSIPFIGTTSVKSNSFDCIVRSSGSEVKKTNGSTPLTGDWVFIKHGKTHRSNRSGPRP